jgi:hypothetical protein
MKIKKEKKIKKCTIEQVGAARLYICIYMSNIYAFLDYIYVECICVYILIYVHMYAYICINMHPSASRFHMRIFVDYVCKFMQLGAA